MEPESLPLVANPKRVAHGQVGRNRGVRFAGLSAALQSF
jgi:hypothetical protein